jgi:hypothetical protein
MLFSGRKNGFYTLTIVQVENDLTIKEIGSYTFEKDYNSICGASFTKNEILLLHREASDFKVSRLSFLPTTKTLPIKSEQQALFITESSSLAISDCLSSPNF